MHTWLGLVAGILVVVAGTLIISASLGIALGITFETAIAVGIVLLVVAGIVAWLFYTGIKAQFRRIKTGKEALIGAQGVVTNEISPTGEVRVLGEFWQAKTKGDIIAAGTEVEVTGMEGMFLLVKSTEQKA